MNLQQTTDKKHPLTLDDIVDIAINSLEDLKAKNITILEVAHLTEVAERIIIAEATSKRHVSAMADKLGASAKQQGLMPLGREGDKDSDWTLVDLGAVIVHVMTENARKFYDLEGLWGNPNALQNLSATMQDKSAML